MTATHIMPTMRYRDARRMIAWLGEAFGFTPHLVVDGEGETVTHAQLVLGKVMIMLGSERDDEYGEQIGSPTELGKTTQTPYIVIDDVDAMVARAEAAGARILVTPHDEDYGGRHFNCLDPEGHLWNFGSYDPWKAEH